MYQLLVILCRQSSVADPTIILQGMDQDKLALIGLYTLQQYTNQIEECMQHATH